MAKLSVRSGNGARAAQASRYDAHHTVLSKTYGALADLRRELADSKAAVGERGDLLRTFSGWVDRSEEHTSGLQSQSNFVFRRLPGKKTSHTRCSVLVHTARDCTSRRVDP